MAIVGVSGSSLKVGTLNGILRADSGLVSVSAPGSTYVAPDYIDQEFAVLQGVLGFANPIRTRWVVAEAYSLYSVSGSSIVGFGGSVRLTTGAVAGKICYVVNHATVISTQIPTSETNAVWGWTFRFSIPTAPDATTISTVRHNGASAGMLFGAFPAVVANNFCLTDAATFSTDTLVPFDTVVHTVRIYRIANRTYIWMDNIKNIDGSGVAQRGRFVAVTAGGSGGTADAFAAASGQQMFYTTNGAGASVQMLDCYWSICLTDRV